MMSVFFKGYASYFVTGAIILLEKKVFLNIVCFYCCSTAGVRLAVCCIFKWNANELCYFYAAKNKSVESS